MPIAAPPTIPQNADANARPNYGGQNTDLDLLRVRLIELEARQKQLETANAQMAQLQAEVNSLTERLHQYEIQSVAPQQLPPQTPVAYMAQVAPPETVSPPQLIPLPPAPAQFTPLPPVSPSTLSPMPATTQSPAMPNSAAASNAAPNSPLPNGMSGGPNLPSNGPSTDQGHAGYGYADGLQFGFWGWIGYQATPQERDDSFYAWQTELDITKSFSDRIAASADLDFYDWNGNAEVEIDQLFVSFLFPEWNDAILTAGKFDAPFGIERPQFWYRETGSTSLLYNALPQEITGLMSTNHWNACNLTFRTFVVNGINVDPDNNQQPSIGSMIEYDPTKNLSFALTNWWGPELPNDNHDKLFFTEAQAIWKLACRLTVSGEFLYGISQIPGDFANYTGFLVILDQRLNDKWRVFAQYSDLNDPYGFFLQPPGHAREANAGVAWDIDPHVEMRAEYRHDMGSSEYEGWATSQQSDTVSLELSFGY